MKDLFIKELGFRIQTLRMARRLTQEQLAEQAGLHPVYISAIERGTRCASLPTLERITQVLGVTFSELFAGIEHCYTPTEPIYEASRLFSSMSHAKQRLAVTILRDFLV